MLIRTAILAGLALIAIPSAPGALTLGLIDDFEDGTLGGWAPPRANTANVAGGPAGSTRYLEVSSGGRLAAFDAGPDILGAIDPAVTAITLDMFRASGSSALEMRLVLFGPGLGDRWTSTAARIFPGDGTWQSYTFSILESDLTRVAGGGSYAALTGNLNRIMIRHDTGAPSAQGTAVPLNADPFGIDNVRAVPEPSGTWLVAGALTILAARSRRRRA